MAAGAGRSLVSGLTALKARLDGLYTDQNPEDFFRDYSRKLRTATSSMGIWMVVEQLSVPELLLAHRRSSLRRILNGQPQVILAATIGSSEVRRPLSNGFILLDGLH